MQVGDGIIGMAAARAEPMRIGNLGKMLAYARSIRRAYEESGVEAPGHEIPLPGLAEAESQVAVPAIVLGQLVGVLVIESRQRVAFTADDEALLTIVATMVASAIEIDWAQERAEADVGRAVGDRGTRAASALPRPRRRACGSSRSTAARSSTATTSSRASPAASSGCCSRNTYVTEESTSPTRKSGSTRRSSCPEFRDNLESRLILLKRRLDERVAPIRIEKTGRGRFRLSVATGLELSRLSRSPR